jgi:short-chain fatty acids transporter
VGFAARFELLFRTLLPGPFTIAVLLTVFTFFLSFGFGTFEDASLSGRLFSLMQGWEAGLWDNSLLVFAVQMMLMLVLGHVLALSPPADKIMGYVLRFCHSPGSAAAIVAVLTMSVAWFNWGLGLIFGALFARKCGAYARARNISVNYPLLGAAGYSGLMIWHGGISGSSLAKAAENGHLQQLADASLFAQIPSAISYSQTVFSPSNLTVTLLLMFLVGGVFYFLGKTATPQPIQEVKADVLADSVPKYAAEHIDYSVWVSRGFAGVVLSVVAFLVYKQTDTTLFQFFTPNHINLLLLGLALAAHRHFQGFLNAVQEAVGGVSGILIQFPLYFGIMGMLKVSGLIDLFALGVSQWATTDTFPFFTFISAAIVNIFVPSGGGQWAIQGPVIIESALRLGVPIEKALLAFAYGDQLTNMLQPFWALPLLGVTGLRARDILPWCLVLFACGLMVFGVAVLW